MTRQLRFAGAALLIAALTTPATAAKTSDVATTVKRMQTFYDGTKDLKGKFKQVYTDTLYNRKRTSYGYLYVKKPGMLRWNYVRPERKAFISTGKELWVWEPSAKQAFRNPLSADTLSTALPFLVGTGDVTKEFDVAITKAKEDQLGSPDDIVLRLTPKKPTAQYKYLVFAVRSTDYAVSETMVVTKTSRNHFIFTGLERNSKLSLSRFRFKPPTGTRVIDGAKLNRRGK